MLRKSLPPLDTYLADAMTRDAAAFLARWPWPMLVIPEPDPKVLAKIKRPETVVRDEEDPTLLTSWDPTRPAMSGASLDALCLELVPKRGAERVRIGRSPEADVVLLDETISRFHAEIAWDTSRERARLRDLGGRNGTHVDGARVEPDTDVSLLAGAVITFGGLSTRYYSPRSFLAWISTGAPRSGAAPMPWPVRT